jgi:hypothetical protein
MESQSIQRKNDFTIEQNSLFYNIHLAYNESSILISACKLLSPHVYQNEYTMENFKKINKVFILFENLKSIYEYLTDKLNEKSVEIAENSINGNLMMKFLCKFENNEKTIILTLSKNANININDKIEEISNFVQKMLNNITITNINTMKDSTMVRLGEEKILKSWIGMGLKVEFNLLYKASLHGYLPEDFHRHCDNQGPTLSIFETLTGARFGGFTRQCWDKSSSYKEDYSAFVFSLDRKQRYPVRNKKRAIYCYSGYFPTFGFGYDIFISEIGFGKSTIYFPHNSEMSKISGTNPFIVKDIEVFAVKINT